MLKWDEVIMYVYLRISLDCIAIYCFVLLFDLVGSKWPCDCLSAVNFLPDFLILSSLFLLVSNICFLLWTSMDHCICAVQVCPFMEMNNMHSFNVYIQVFLTFCCTMLCTSLQILKCFLWLINYSFPCSLINKTCSFWTLPRKALVWKNMSVN